MIEIPDGWQQMQWRQQVRLANDIQEAARSDGPAKAPVTEAAAARAVIEHEVRRQSRENVTARDHKTDERPKDDGVVRNVPLRLLRDTWEGENRVRADGTTTLWSLDDAKRLIASGVAIRMDPLPGE